MTWILQPQEKKCEIPPSGTNRWRGYSWYLVLKYSSMIDRYDMCAPSWRCTFWIRVKQQYSTVCFSLFFRLEFLFLAFAFRPPSCVLMQQPNNRAAERRPNWHRLPSRSVRLCSLKHNFVFVSFSRRPYSTCRSVLTTTYVFVFVFVFVSFLLIDACGVRSLSCAGWKSAGVQERRHSYNCHRHGNAAHQEDEQRWDDVRGRRRVNNEPNDERKKKNAECVEHRFFLNSDDVEMMTIILYLIL